MQNDPRFTVNRRQLLTLTGAAGLTGLAAACSGPGTTTAPSSPEGPDTEGPAEGEVSFAHWRAEDKEVFDELIADFESENSGITISQTISTSTDYEAQALRRMRGGEIGDVAPAFRGTQFESFVESGLFVDLSDTDLVSRYNPSLITVGEQDGKQYGFPYQVVFNVPIANMDILESVGVQESPQDWDSYIEMLEAIKAKGITPIAFPGADAGNAGQLFNAMIMNIAPSDDMCTKIQAGEYKLTDDWFIEMLRLYQQLGDYVQPNAGGTAVEPAEQMFATGDAALLSTGSYHIASVRTLGGEFPIDLAPPITSAPGEARYVGIYNATFILGINSASDVQPAAMAWLEYLSTPEIAARYADGTAQFASVQDVEYSNPDLQAIAPWLDKELALAPRYQFTDLDMRLAVEASAVDALTGTDPEQAAEHAQEIVDQRIAAS